MTQSIAWTISAALVTLVLLAFAFIAAGASTTGEAGPIAAASTRWRSRIFWGLVILFVPILGYTLSDLPYPKPDESAKRLIVAVTGYQWRWDISPTEYKVGQPVEFRVTAADVNHGFAIYDADLHVVAQTQAMPGYTNVLRYTFERAGTYKVLCLEYCGIAHHGMMAELTVVQSPEAP